MKLVEYIGSDQFFDDTDTIEDMADYAWNHMGESDYNFQWLEALAHAMTANNSSEMKIMFKDARIMLTDDQRAKLPEAIRYFCEQAEK
jgi:vancomycin resistance protein YoaR